MNVLEGRRGPWAIDPITSQCPRRLRGAISYTERGKHNPPKTSHKETHKLTFSPSGTITLYRVCSPGDGQELQTARTRGIGRRVGCGMTRSLVVVDFPVLGWDEGRVCVACGLCQWLHEVLISGRCSIGTLGFVGFGESPVLSINSSF
jgi:hypothetical protein